MGTPGNAGVHLRLRIIRIDNRKGFAFVTVVHEPRVSASPGNLLKLQNLGTLPRRSESESAFKQDRQ